MRKATIGDIYAFKTERGYRLIHWAYHIEKQGKFVRVLPNFYDSIPENIDELIAKECDYILCFDAPKAYRKRLFEWIGNYSEFDKIELFPRYDINYVDYGETSEIKVCEFNCHQNFERFVCDDKGNGLPEKYKNIKLINAIVDPIWFIYLISSDFNLNNWSLFYPGELWDVYEKKYGDIIFGKNKKC